MKAKQRGYRPESDFMRVRNLLVDSYSLGGRPYNWCIERWNYARYFVVPMLATHRRGEPTAEQSLEAIRRWEATIGVWENEEGQLVGVTLSEYPWMGEAFFLRHPQYACLLDEMFDYAEATFADREQKTLQINVYDGDEPLRAVALRRGYRQDAEHPWHDSEYVIGELPVPRLPRGYVVRSMAEEENIELRRELLGRAFNHTDPAEWPSAFSYRELQKAPDYRQDQDLCVVGPRGEYVSCCIVWYDAHNRFGRLEPVGTHPDYRLRGFGREVVMEAVRRVAARGGRSVWVGAAKPFYLAIGFQKRYTYYPWTVKV